MLHSLLEQKHPFAAFVAEHEVSASFTSNQWGLIENVIKILEPFEALISGITWRFGGTEGEREPLYSLATLLDPRYKDQCCSAEARGLLLVLDGQIGPNEGHGPGANNADEPAEKMPRHGSLSSMLTLIMDEDMPQQASPAVS